MTNGIENYKYYLVSLADKGITRNLEFDNRLVVGMHPTDWLVASGHHEQYVLVNCWEITEGTFTSFSHGMQNAAWDEFYQLTGEEDDS